MPAAAHRVRLQRWRVAARSAGEAFTLRTRLKAAVEDELLPVFGLAFDEAAPEDALLHIPRLELRLRVPSLDALAGALGEALGEALRRELRVRPPPPPRAAAAERLSVLLGYLDSGTLAWHAAHLDIATITPELRAALLANLSPIVHRARRETASFERAMRYCFRLLQLLPPQDWPEVAACVEPVDAPLPAAQGTPSAGTSPTPRQVSEPAELLALPEREWPPAAARMIAAVGGLRAAIAPLATGRVALARHDALRLAAALLAAAATQVEPRSSAGERAPAARTQVMDLAEQRGKAASAAPDAPRAVEHSAALMAASVGLVLLHPFLPQLFGTCELYREGELVSLPRAAALLHWLATGREEVFEFELGFVKLLLGLHPETPLVVGEGLLGAHEREEGQALLNAALGHWKALRGTTPDGLRLAFLQRRGALREADDGWRLQPESESYDVLLGHLPWGFATVKLPWMTRPLYTDWPTP